MDSKNFKVLFVEDEHYLIDLFSIELRQMVNTVLTAENGIEALKILEQEQDVDLIITDLMMPHMGGIELLQKAKERFPNLLSIVITGNRDRSQVIKAINIGVYDFLEKPVSVEIFRHQIKKALHDIANRKTRDQILEYLLHNLTTTPIDQFYRLDNKKQHKILSAVMQVVKTKVLNMRSSYE